MAYHQRAEEGAQSKKDETVLVVGSIRVRDKDGVLVRENRPGFLEGNAVLLLIEAPLALVPLEPDLRRGLEYALQCSGFTNRSGAVSYADPVRPTTAFGDRTERRNPSLNLRGGS